MPGRYPKLIEEIEADNSRTHKTKAEIEARKAATPQGESAYLRAPDWLNDVARREWRRIIRLARRSGIFTNLDLNALGMYCQSYSRLRLAYQEYDKLQAKIGDKQTALVTSKMQINPLIKLMQQEEEQCRRWGGLLGLDPTGRARIGLARNRKEEQSEFEQFLSNVQDGLNGEI